MLAQHLVQRRDVLDIRAAAAADQVQPVLDDEALNPGREFLGAQGITRLSVDEFGKARIREQAHADSRDVRLSLKRDHRHAHP